MPKQLSATCRWRLWCFVLHLPFEDNRMEAIRDLLKHSEAQPQPATAKVWHGHSKSPKGLLTGIWDTVSMCFTPYHFARSRTLRSLGSPSRFSSFNCLSVELMKHITLGFQATACTFHVCPGILRWGSAGNSMGQTSTIHIQNNGETRTFYFRDKTPERWVPFNLMLPGLQGPRRCQKLSAVGKWRFLWLAVLWRGTMGTIVMTGCDMHGKKHTKFDSDSDMVNNGTQTQMTRVTKWFAKIEFFFFNRIMFENKQRNVEPLQSAKFIQHWCSSVFFLPIPMRHRSETRKRALSFTGQLHLPAGPQLWIHRESLNSSSKKMEFSVVCSQTYRYSE